MYSSRGREQIVASSLLYIRLTQVVKGGGLSGALHSSLVPFGCLRYSLCCLADSHPNSLALTACLVRNQSPLSTTRIKALRQSAPTPPQATWYVASAQLQLHLQPSEHSLRQHRLQLRGRAWSSAARASVAWASMAFGSTGFDCVGFRLTPASERKRQRPLRLDNLFDRCR